MGCTTDDGHLCAVPACPLGGTRPSLPDAPDAIVRYASFRHRLAGHWARSVGSLTILLGALLGSRTLLVYGHRRRVIGVLQESCAVDRRTVDAFIDRWMSRQTISHYAIR